MIILAPIGWLYGRVMQVRNALYDRGIFRSFDLGAKTISVGNITTGGTGKTPLVAYVAKLLAENGEKVCILTRGYGRKDENERVLVSDGAKVLVDAQTGGDEPVELAIKLIGKAIVVADADRSSAAGWARSTFEITAFVLDDAFQHRRAKRDLDIVCIDAADAFGDGRVLPAGRLRESINALGRADAVVITRSGHAENVESLEDHLRKINSKCRIFRSSTSITKFVSIDEFHAKTQSTQSEPPKNAFAFSGLANNENFLRSLDISAIPSNGKIQFGDHHDYSQRDLEEIETLARSRNARCLITTAKDAVKLGSLKFSMPCYVAVIETVIEDPEGFRELVLSV